MVTDLDPPAAALAGCTVFQSVTIFYPLSDMPDLERRGRRSLRPRAVKLYASRTNNAPWRLNAPLVIGREVLKNGALSNVERTTGAFLDEPQWLTDVAASIEAALNGERQ